MACAHNPAQRFSNATAFKTALLRVQGGATDPNVIFAGLLRTPVAPQPLKDAPKKEVQKKEEKEPKKKMKKWKKILLSATISLLVLGIAAGVLFLSWYLSPEQKMLRALEAENFEEAVEIYEKDLEGEDADSVTEVLSERLVKLKDSYIAQTRDYATTLAELDSIKSMGVEDIAEMLAETREFVQTLNSSRTAFNTAETMLQEGDYDGAIAQYALVE